MKTFSVKSNCKRQARKILGADAVEGADFKVGGAAGAWFFEILSKDPAPSPAGAPKEKIARGTKGSKGSEVLAMLKRPEGVTIAEISAAHGWLAHSCRGFISGTVRKKLAFPVATERVAGRGLVYRIVQ